MKRSSLQLLAFAAAAACAPLTAAHAFLDHAVPTVGSAVHASPLQVKLWFTQELEPAFSTVRVFDQSGKQIDSGDSQVDTADATLLLVSLPQLGPGTYRVTWRVLSVDTHITAGDFTFDVAP